MNEPLIELESKLAFLEKSNNDLSDVVYAQQRQIDQLFRQVTRLNEKLLAIEPDDVTPFNNRDERPPHY